MRPAPRQVVVAKGNHLFLLLCLRGRREKEVLKTHKHRQQTEKQDVGLSFTPIALR
jgi:hypothetical protein